MTPTDPVPPDVAQPHGLDPQPDLLPSDPNNQAADAPVPTPVPHTTPPAPDPEVGLLDPRHSHAGPELLDPPPADGGVPNP